MSQLFFLRHGETAYNVEQSANSPESKVGSRSNELELTDLGEIQAAVAAEYFERHDIYPTRWYSSPAVRTLNTGWIVTYSLGLGLEPIIDDGLQEMSQGAAEGKLRSEIWTPETSKQAVEGGMDFKLPGGESLEDVMVRKRQTIETILRENNDSQTIMVTGHGMALRCLAASVHGWGREEILAAKTPNCSLTSVSFHEDQLAIDFFAKNIVGAEH